MKKRVKKKEGLGKLTSEIFGEDWPDRGWRRPSIADIPSISNIRRSRRTSAAPSIPTIKQSLREHLLQTPLFKHDKEGKLVFHHFLSKQIPKKPLDAERLLDLLVDELYRFFDSNIDKIADFIIKHPPIHPAVDALRESIPAFIAAGIKEKSLMKTIEQVGMWAHRSFEHDLYTNLHRIDGRDLIKPLFDIFEEYAPRLTNDGMFYSIAHILKEFRLESGDVDGIFKRIKRHSASSRHGLISTPR